MILSECVNMENITVQYILHSFIAVGFDVQTDSIHS